MLSFIDENRLPMMAKRWPGQCVRLKGQGKVLPPCHINDALRIPSGGHFFLVMKNNNGNGMANSVPSKLTMFNTSAVSEVSDPKPSQTKTTNPMAIERPSAKTKSSKASASATVMKQPPMIEEKSSATVMKQNSMATEKPSTKVMRKKNDGVEFEASFKLKIAPSAFFIGVGAASKSFKVHSNFGVDYSMRIVEESLFKYRPKFNAKFDNRLIVQQIEIFKFMIIALLNPSLELGIDLGAKMPKEVEIKLNETIEKMKIKGREDTKKLKNASDWTIKKIKALSSFRNIEKVEVEVLKESKHK